MAKRSYKQNCALAHAVDVVGERWSLLIIRELLLGPRRFSELNKALKGMGTNLLVSRLREFEGSRLIDKEAYGRSHRYKLTARGRALEATVLALVRWGMRFANKSEPGFVHRPEWDLVALKALFEPDGAQVQDLCVEFAADEWQGWAAIREGELEVGLGHPESADVVVWGSVQDLFRPTGSHKPRLTGNVERLQRFMGAFTAQPSG